MPRYDEQQTGPPEMTEAQRKALEASTTEIAPDIPHQHITNENVTPKSLVETLKKKISDDQVKDVFDSMSSFENAQRMAKMLCSSDIVPDQYRGERNIANCVVALARAKQMRMGVLDVMQNLDIIRGNPSWRSNFVIGAINASRKFSTDLRFKVEGDPNGKDWSCTAWAVDATGEVVEGVKITYAMAKSEGWLDRKDSKWKTIPELMMRYRAATFFGRLYCPDILHGMRTADELEDLTVEAVQTAEGVYEPKGGVDALKHHLQEKEAVVSNAKEPKSLEEQAERVKDSPFTGFQLQEGEEPVEIEFPEPKFDDEKPKSEKPIERGKPGAYNILYDDNTQEGGLFEEGEGNAGNR